MTDELDEAWTELHANTPPGWYVGQPMEHPERNEWAIFAFDTNERPVEGKRSREWTAVAPMEFAVSGGLDFSDEVQGSHKDPGFDFGTLVFVVAGVA